MTQIENELYRKLCELEAAVGGMNREGTKPDLVRMFDELEALSKTLPDGTSPDLRHYLMKKSYQKARHFLEGKPPENDRIRDGVGRC